ncbi:MAG: hypothetical protein AAF687_08215 [Pseudomonadota bacterium]
MKKSVLVLASLMAALVAFYVWHTPFGGPLSDAEIDAFMTEQAEAVGTTWTDEDAFEAFLREDDGRPFVMINLMEYRGTAQYPQGSELDADLSGKEAGALYGQSVLPQLFLRGSYPVARAERHNTIINSVGDTAGEFESFAMVRYRSRRDLIDMLGSDAFRAANDHKWASLENTLVAPSDSAPAFGFVGYIPWVLFVGIGIVLGFLARGWLAKRSSDSMPDKPAD